MTSPQELINAHMRTIAHRVIDVFENAEDDALAEDVMQEVFAAIGLVEAFTGPTAQPIYDGEEVDSTIRGLDRRGITAVNFRDPEDGSVVPGITIPDAAQLLKALGTDWVDPTPLGSVGDGDRS
jgi:hypothetical protein